MAGRLQYPPSMRTAIVLAVNQGESKAAVARRFNISRMTVIRIVQGITAENSWHRDPCGTNGGYARHLRNKEKACPDCCLAHAKFNEKLKKRRRRRSVNARGARRRSE